jgi:hypothetical protein
LQRPVRKLQDVDPGAKPAPSQAPTDVGANADPPSDATLDNAGDGHG